MSLFTYVEFIVKYLSDPIEIVHTKMQKQNSCCLI